MDCKNRYKYVSASDCKEFLCNNFELIEGTPKPETLYKINEDSLSPLEPQSAHKASEVFDENLEYAGKKELMSDGDAVICERKKDENGYQEVLRPRKKEVPVRIEEEYKESQVPTIICLCGSTRFKQEFIDANFRETMKGKIVLTVGCFGHADKSVYFPSQKEKFMLDELHKRKIDLSDEILVLNVGGYIGESTQNEINYAKNLNKKILFLEYKEPCTTVHYWDKDGKEGQYSFKGTPDLDRIYRETIGEGQLAVWVNVGRYVHVFVKPITSIWFSSGEWYEQTWRRDEVYRELGAAVKDYIERVKDYTKSCQILT